MSVLGKFTKQSAEVESYTVVYEDDLTDGDGVVNSDVSVTPDGLTIKAIDRTLRDIRVWVSDGVSGVKYKVEITATTGGGRVLQDEFFVTVKDI